MKCKIGIDKGAKNTVGESLSLSPKKKILSVTLSCFGFI